MTGQFPEVSLGEILRKSTDWIDIEPNEEYKEITVKLWGKGVVLRRQAKGAEIASLKRLRVKPQQFILSRIDARNGAIGLVPNELDGGVVSNDFPTFSPNLDRVLPAYLGWLSKTGSFVELCKTASEGTTNRVRLQEDRFLSYRISLPSLPEQRRIVARIEQLAAKIGETHALRQQADKEVATLWQQGAAGVFAKLGETCAIRPLADVVLVRGGGTPSKSDPFYWDGKIPWITPKDMKIRELSDAIDHISERATKETAAKVIAPGSVLVVVRGMILVHTVPSAVLRAPAAINQDMKALVLGADILPEFLCTFFWADNPRMLDLVEKSTHDTRKLETPKLLNLTIPVPSLPEQRRIVAELDALHEKVAALKRLQTETATELDALLPSILDKAFKGAL